MIKLYGTPLSNYFNMARHALHEKGIAYELVNLRPSQEPDFLAKSPMGKVPVLETTQGFITETDAILDYLEETCTQVPLLPKDPFARAKVRQLMKVQELYVESPSHDLIGALFKREIPAHVLANSQPAARKGLAALGRLLQLQPWLCGEQLTLADIFVFYSFTLSNRLTQLVYQWNMLDEIPGLASWYQRFSEGDVARMIVADNKAASEALAARVNAK